MGLTDREKKIIEEMEAALTAEDPRLAASLVKPVRPSILLNVIGLLAGIALILAGVIAKLVILGVLGFLVALASLATIRVGKLTIKAPKPPKSGGMQARWDRRAE
mgnify:CR=1 FL=1|jgi:hypothetical protein